MAQRTCSYRDCQRVMHAKGYCKAHYLRSIRGKRMDAPIREWVLTAEERFWSKVNKAGPIPEHRPDLGPCWIWTASLNRGYGQLSHAGRPAKAHRFAYELLIGPIPEGLEPDHLCCVTACVNPFHLEPVTHAENARRTGERRTHCKRGHEFTTENTIYQRSGRTCRICRQNSYARRKRS